MPGSMEHLLWFYENLEQQVEDIQYKRDEKQTVLFFDTFDMRAAVVGFPDFYDQEHQFNKKKFEEKRTLVRSLVVSGCIEEVQMLPPHQFELIQVLKRDVPRSFDQWKKDFDRFFSDFYSYLGLSFSQNSDVLNNLGEYLHRKSDLADAWFKFMQNFEPWHRRFAALTRLEILNLDEERKSWMSDIVAMKELEELKTAFEHDVHRKNLFLNNITDAITLTYLIKMVQMFNDGRSNIVPRFFDPAPASGVNGESEVSTFQKAIKSSKLEDSFYCRNAKSSIFRNEDYFIFKVALRNPFANDSKEEETDQRVLNLYEEMSPRIADCKSPEDFIGIHFEGKPLDVLIESLQKYAFLKNDWLLSRGQQELINKLEAYKPYLSNNEKLQQLYVGFTEFYGSDERQSKIDADITNKKAQLKKNVEQELKDVKFVKEIWQPLDEAIKSFGKRIRPDDAGFYHVIRDAGLLRYGFPREHHQNIERILQNLGSGDAERTRQARADVINAYLQAKKSSKENAAQLVLPTAVFVALRLNNEVIRLLETKKHTHFSLKTVYAEMLLRQSNGRLSTNGKTNWRKATRIIQELKENLDDFKNKALEQADLHITIAYLSHLAWKFQVEDALWRRQILTEDLTQFQTEGIEWQQAFPLDDFEKRHEENKEYITQATKHAVFALKLLDEKTDLSKKVFALNQFLFYTVEGGDLKLFESVRPAVQQLSNYKENKLVWRYQYDDTLARYFHRRSLMIADEKDKRSLVTYAREHIEKARVAADGDSDIEHYYTVLNAYEASII